MSKSFKIKEVNEFKYVKNGILYTVEAVNLSNFSGNIYFNAEIDGEIRSIIYILDTGAWLYDNEIDVYKSSDIFNSVNKKFFPYYALYKDLLTDTDSALFYSNKCSEPVGVMILRPGADEDTLHISCIIVSFFIWSLELNWDEA